MSEDLKASDPRPSSLSEDVAPEETNSSIIEITIQYDTVLKGFGMRTRGDIDEMLFYGLLVKAAFEGFKRAETVAAHERARRPSGIVLPGQGIPIPPLRGQ